MKLRDTKFDTNAAEMIMPIIDAESPARVPCSGTAK